MLPCICALTKILKYLYILYILYVFHDNVFKVICCIFISKGNGYKFLKFYFHICSRLDLLGSIVNFIADRNHYEARAPCAGACCIDSHYGIL